MLSVSHKLCRVEHLKVYTMTGRMRGVNFRSCRIVDQELETPGIIRDIEDGDMLEVRLLWSLQYELIDCDELGFSPSSID